MWERKEFRESDFWATPQVKTWFNKNLWLDEDVDGHECADEAEGGHGGQDDALRVEQEEVRGGAVRHRGSDEEGLQGEKRKWNKLTCFRSGFIDTFFEYSS